MGCTDPARFAGGACPGSQDEQVRGRLIPEQLAMSRGPLATLDAVFAREGFAGMPLLSAAL